MSIGLLPILLALTPLGVEPEPAASVSEAWSRLTDCGAAADDTRDWERLVACRAAARDVLRLGGESDRERMWDRFQMETGPLRTFLFTSLVESYVSDATGELSDAPARARSAPAAPATDLPKALETASPELKDAYLFFRGAMSRAWPDSTVPEEERIAYVSLEGREQFQQLVADFLRGRSDTAATRAALDRFEFGGRCGSGSSEFINATSAVRLVASIREGRIDADAAVAYVVGSSLVDGDHGSSTDERVLKAAGLDWESLYVGAVVAGGPWHIAPLLRSGSDRSARLLLEIASLAVDVDAVPGETHQVLAPMAAFVSSEGPCEGYKTVSSEDFGRHEDAPPIGAEVQQSILDALAGQVQPGAGLDAAQNASHALLRLCRAESRDAFSAMLRSPYAQVRERGAIALRALGESVDNPAPAAPVAFRVVVDGRPWPSAVSWQLEGTHGFRGGSETPDRDGVVRVERDPFVDPTAPVESVTLASSDLDSPDDTWFSVRFKPPADLDDRTLLTVRTGALTVVVPPSVRASSGGQPEPQLILQAQVEDEDYSVGNLFVRAGSYRFPHLQHGTYTASVILPDGTLLESTEVEVGERPQTVALVPVPRTHDTIGLEDGEEVDTPR